MMTTVQVHCPKCGQGLTARHVDAVAYGTPDFQKLLAGTLNCCKCPSCGTVFHVSGQLIYRESDPPFILVQHEMPVDGDTEAIEKDVDVIVTTVAADHNQPRPVVRLVFCREDFLEKIFLHRDGHDDRMIEYVKYQLFQGGTDKLLSRRKYRLLYDFSAHDVDDLVFAVFDRETMKPVNCLKVPRLEYSRQCEEFDLNPDLQKQLDMLFPNCVVSVDRLFEQAKEE